MSKILSSMGIRAKLAIPTVAMGVAIAVFTFVFSARQAEDQITLSAVSTSMRLIDQVKEMRGYYTANVVGPVKDAGMAASHEHDGVSGTVPLPATFVHELSDLINSRSTDQGFELHLYSDYPFPFRENGGPRDDFEREALDYLTANPDSVFYRRETYQGAEVVRAAAADVMQAQGCVDCHNSHPDTPKDDWKLGDVRGVLEVSVPVSDTKAAFASSARTTGFSVAVGILAILLVVGFVMGRFLSPLKNIVNVAGKIADGDLSQEIDYVADDKIGSLGQAMVGMKTSLESVLSDAGTLIGASASGKLDTRVEAERYRGVYQGSLAVSTT